MSTANRIAPHVAAVHDLSGMGRCSLGVVAPVLSAMGCWCSALPTAYLSANTIFPPSDHFIFRDLTDEMAGSLDHWEELKVSFRALYSGFVGSERQIGVVADFFRRFRKEGTFVLVDPVMGDWGKPYRTYTPAMCGKMKELASLADLITPNLTEAAILLNEAYDPSPDREKAADWLRRLSLDGRRSVIITGLSLSPDTLGAGCYDRETDAVELAQAPLAHGIFSGTGDLFASVAFGKLLAGESLPVATQAAVRFVSLAANATLDRGGDPVEGADFEPLLPLLAPQEV